MIPHVAKATGVYLNSMLAVTEANRAGYDEAILLTAEGFVADGSGENVFIVKDGEIYTPDLSTSILPGITRDTVIQIAQDLGYRVHEKALIRSDLYLADEVFMTRHRGRGDAAPLGRRRRDRRRADHARDPGGLPRHRARPQRALGRSGSSTPRPRRPRREHRPRGEIPLARPLLDEREEELVLEVLRSGRLSLGPTIDRFEELIAERVGAPYAAAVSSGTAGLHLLVPDRRARAGRRGDHLADLVRRDARTASSSRARRRSSPTSTRAR